MTKKFSIKKLVAGVMATAMVLTALPVSGLSVKAAGEIEGDTVWRLYNPNNGEHLFTTSKAEYDANVALGYAGEGTSWVSPKTSATPLYRVYNPNSGEHLLMTKDEATATVAAGWKDEGQKMYSDDAQGVPIYRCFNPNDTSAGSHLYTPNAEEAQYLESIGWTWENNHKAFFYGVGENLSSEVKLVDKNGLQTDGTALRTDTLEIQFGSNFGTPKAVTWYRNGSVVAVYTDDLPVGCFKMAPGKDSSGNIIKLDAGEYYAAVENTAGKIYKTNTLIVTDDNKARVVSFSLNDNYEALAKFAEDTATNEDYSKGAPQPATETNEAVISITLNKKYAGKIHLIDEDVKKRSDVGTDVYYEPIKVDTNGFTVYADGVKKVDKKSDFTDENLAYYVYGDVPAKALAYENNDETVSIKLPVSSFENAEKGLTRGTKYRVVYDQDNSFKAGSELKDWVVSDLIEMPYLYTPDKLEVTDPTTDTKFEPGWTLTASFKGTKAGWLTTVTAYDHELTYAGNVTAELFTNDTQSAKDGKSFGNNVNYVEYGVAKRGGGAYANSSENYVYGTMKIKKGICGKDEVNLTSEAIPVPDAVAENAEIDYDSDKPEAATVKFSKLRGDSTVYITYGTSKVGTPKFDKDDSTTYRAKADVKAKATSIEIEDVFKQKDIDDPSTDLVDPKDFYVVVVPKDASSYAKFETAEGGEFNVEDSAKKYVLSGKTTDIQVSTPASVTVTVKNQFGNDMLIDEFGGAKAAGMEFSAGKAGSTQDADFGCKLEQNTSDHTLIIGSGPEASGALSEMHNYYKGDTYTWKINDSTKIEFICTDAGNGKTAKWKVVIS